MKIMKINVLCLGLVVWLVLLSFVSADVRINEVMPHTNNTYGDEWIELYNNGAENVSLTDWKIADASADDTISINISAGGYALIIDSSNGNCSFFNIPNESCIGLLEIGGGLNNDVDNVSLYNESSILISSFAYSIALTSFGKSWGLNSSGSWLNCTPTPGAANNCTQTCTFSSVCSGWSTCSNSLQTKTCTNTSTSCVNTTYNITQSCNTTTEPTITLEWEDEDIVNSDEFWVTVKAYNLLDEDYDVRVWIEFEDNDTTVSDRYGEYGSDGEVWKSGRYYIDKLFSGPGNKSTDVNIRLNEDYEDLHGADFVIKAKLMETASEDVIDTEEKDIEILDGPDSDSSSDNTAATSTNNAADSSNTTVSDGTIVLGKSANETNDDLETENSIIYKSASEYIKEYAPYAFSLLCIVLIALLLIDKKK